MIAILGWGALALALFVLLVVLVALPIVLAWEAYTKRKGAHVDRV